MIQRLRCALLALAGLASLASSLPAQPAADGTFRLSFWNLEWFPGHRPESTAEEQKVHIENVQPEVAKLAPDVMGFSEVLDWKAVEAAVAKVPGLKVCVVSAFKDSDGKVTKQQTAVASKFPCIGAWFEPWKANAQGFAPRRGFAFAALQPAPDRILLVYSLHLKSNRKPDPGDPPNEKVREESAKQLMAHVKAMQAAYGKLGKVAVIIGGDMNTSLDDPRFGAERTLRDFVSAGYTWPLALLEPKSRFTMPGHGRFPPTTFDHILHTGPIKTKSIVVGDTGPECSDHRSINSVMVWQ